MESVSKLFTEKTEGERTFYPLNTELILQFSNEQEAVQFLVEAIRFWRNKRSFFCNGVTSKYEGKECVDLPEEEWTFDYKTPSSCGRCVNGQKILDKIFGDRHKFNALPFVEYHGDRQYSFSFDLLKYFAENGHDSTVRFIEERKQETARKKIEFKFEEKSKLLQEQNNKLSERLRDMVISDELREQILPYASNGSLTIINPEIAVVITDRSDFGTTGGVAYYDQVHVFYGSQADMKEWQWRDRYSASNDKPWLRVHSIGAVNVVDKDDKVSVGIELVNNNHDNRTVTYTFDCLNITLDKKLSVDEQATFITKVEQEMARVMSGLEQLWECKPKMVSTQSIGMSDGYMLYKKPWIKQQQLRAEIGVAAFVIEEQIDHRVRDAQMRHSLYVLTTGSEKAECKAEDHGYTSQGGAFLTILEINTEIIVINSKNGKSTISLSKNK